MSYLYHCVMIVCRMSTVKHLVKANSDDQFALALNNSPECTVILS